MRRAIITIGLILMITVPAAAERLKDIVRIKGVVDNPIRGFGLVIGLNGTGDGKGHANKALANIMKRLLEDYSIANEDIQSKNVALVAVTSILPAFANIGSRIDVKASSVGDCSSLKGGTLLGAYLKADGDDETVYAIASGSVLLAGSEEVTPTSGDIPNGGIVAEEELAEYIIIDGEVKKISFLLDNPDFNTANGVVEAIRNDRQLFGRYGNREIAKAISAGQIDVIIPLDVDEVNFISKLLDVTVAVQNEARVVIDESTRTVIIGEGVTVQPVVICHGNLTLVVGNVEQTAASMGPEGEEATPLQQIQDMLNAIKASPEDAIAIIKALKAAGALQGKVIVK